MRKQLYISAACVLIIQLTQGQTENKSIRTGNKLYKEKKYEEALPEFEKAVTENPKSSIGQYNLGNARFRTDNFTDSEKAFEDAAGNTNNKSFKQKALYNKAVSLSKQKKLQESIDAYKQALRLDPQDQDTRFNLQKALAELKKQQQQQQQQQKDQKQQEQKKQKEQKKDEPKPQPQKNNLDKKKIEQFLKSLEQKEQEVQRKMQQNKTRAASTTEKDW